MMRIGVSRRALTETRLFDAQRSALDNRERGSLFSKR
jgi:hypothetical protein